MSTSDKTDDRKCAISFVNGDELLTNSSSDPLRNELLVQGYIREIPTFIPVEMTDLCLEFYYDANRDALRINTLDMGFTALLHHHSVYAGTLYKQLLDDWAMQSGIPRSALAVYNYTQRKDSTMRPNTEILVDFDEKSKGSNGGCTDDQTEQHLGGISSIHDRIGNVKEKNRAFLLLDNRRITTLKGPTSNEDAQTILVALKYFDIFAQKTYFVDWLKIKTTSITFGDIGKHIESDLIPNTMHNGGYLQSLYELNTKMDGRMEQKFLFWEEQAAVPANQNDGISLDRIWKYDADETVRIDFRDGDIIVFQINPHHSYFFSFQCPKEHYSLDYNQRVAHYAYDKSLAHFNGLRKQFHEKGLFWHWRYSTFMGSMVNMIGIQLSVRGDELSVNQLHETLSQCRVDDGNAINQIEEKHVKHLNQSNHSWKVSKGTTYGMLKNRLGSYYGIKPNHFVIWMPKMIRVDGIDQMKYVMVQRDGLITNCVEQRDKWDAPLQLEFEIHTEEVTVFDDNKMIMSEIQKKLKESRGRRFWRYNRMSKVSKLAIGRW